MMNSWNLEGRRIRASYLIDMPVVGTVLESRVKYGGQVQHTVHLDVPLAMKWRTEPADRVLIDHCKVMEIL
jgi:hypothetical protein